MNGIGVEQNYGEAYRWLLKGPAYGCANSIYNIAFMCENGYGLEQSYYSAFEYYNQAANWGNAAAMYCVGYYYEYGITVQTDYASARYWYENALLGAGNDQNLKDMITEALARLDPYFIGYKQDGTPQYSNR